MAKTVDIDLSDDRLIAIAADMLDDHNYIGALKMLNKNAEITGNDEDSYMLYAEIFDDMGLYERSIHHWFKFMDIAQFNELTDCYEGLAVGYMNLGNEHFSAYYYNKLLLETDEVDAATREQIVRDFLSNEENPLKISFPPELADVSDVMNEGVNQMKRGEYDKALETFGGIAEGNPKWSTAHNYMAMCHIISDRGDNAEAECLNILEREPENIQALSTLAAVKAEAGREEEARELTRRLLALDVDSSEEIYKIATVCCENKMHEEAYGLFCKMNQDFANDQNVLYFKAIAAFNSKKFTESFEAFDRLMTIYPDATTAQYYYREARDMYENGEWREMSYFYTLPQEIRESTLKILAAYLKLSKKQAALLDGELDIEGAVKWCFDEANPSNSEELQVLAAQAAVKAFMDDYVRDLLLHPFLSDSLKIDILIALCERGEENSFGVVICNVFKRVSMRKLNTGLKKRINFIRAYSRLVAHFSIIDDRYGERFAVAAEELYKKLEEEQRLDAAKDTDALTAAIFSSVGSTETGITKSNLCAFFGVEEERVTAITGEQL